MLNRRWLKSLLIYGICMPGLMSSVLAQKPADLGEAGWVGLYTAEVVTLLENENQLQALCGHASVDTPQWRECRDKNMQPKQHVFQLRSAPRETATPKGALVILATPGQPLRAYYRPAGKVAGIPFIPDLFDADWGYGPYFHQTFLERRGSWFLLPVDPLPSPAWVNIPEPQVRLVREFQETREVVETQRGDLIVLGMNRRSLRARLAQDADMWCQSGDPPPLKPWKEIHLPVETLYGPTGHLRLDIKYKRGC